MAGDGDAIAAILLPTIRAGATYALDPAMTAVDALAYWLGADRQSFVAVAGGAVVGTYYLRANQPGGGSHVCNCGFMTAAAASGRGIARAMAAHAFATARTAGFLAMQFNCVVATNDRAVRLWHALGFTTVGRLPGAFRHPSHGFVDALVTHRPL